MQKHILFISPRLEQGGAERQIVTIARILKKRENTIDMLCYSYGNFYEDLLKKEGIKVYWLQHNYLLRLITCVIFIIKGHYDVVISFLPTPSFINCFAAMICKRYKVITGERSSNIKKPKSIFGKFSIWLRRYSDVIVCNSNHARVLWEDYFPQYRSKLTTIYNTVDLPTIENKYMPLQDGKLHICVAATIYGTKNPIGLINSIRLMTKEERNRIVIDWYGKKEAEFGNHRIYDEAVSLINKYKLGNTLHFHDATKDIVYYMMMADFVALFSQFEGLPNAICEGMTLGKPIIMSRVSDYSTLIEEGKNGFLCNWDDPTSIKQAILKASYLNKSEIIEMGKRSKKKATKLFSEEEVISKWINIIN